MKMLNTVFFTQNHNFFLFKTLLEEEIQPTSSLSDSDIITLSGCEERTESANISASSSSEKEENLNSSRQQSASRLNQNVS